MGQKQSQQQIKKFRQFFQIFFIDFSAGAHTSCEGAREEKEGGREREVARERGFCLLFCVCFGNGTRSLSFSVDYPFYILFISLFS